MNCLDLSKHWITYVSSFNLSLEPYRRKILQNHRVFRENKNYMKAWIYINTHTHTKNSTVFKFILIVLACTVFLLSRDLSQVIHDKQQISWAFPLWHLPKGNWIIQCMFSYTDRHVFPLAERALAELVSINWLHSTKHKLESSPLSDR